MERILIVPAAGRGSRLGLAMPKLLVPVNGRAMIDHLFTLYADVVDRAALVVHPTAVEEVQAHVAAAPFPVELFVQHQSTGMLDAIRARIPGASDDLLPKRGMWGEEIRNEGGIGPDLASPIWTGTDKRDPVVKELLSIGARIGPVSRGTRR